MPANLIALGAACQAGLLPVSPASVEMALALNGTAVEQSVQAFRYGRVFQHDPERGRALLHPPAEGAAAAAVREAAGLGGARAVHYQELFARSEPLDEESRRLLALRLAELIRFQGIGLARGYLEFVLDTARREREALGAGELAIARSVIRNLYKLLAYKDEYEVARLLLRSSRRRRVEERFTGDLTVRYHLHPPLLRALGMKRKLQLGRWFDPALWLLAQARRLRGTPLDPFGRAEVRKTERRLAGWYRDALLRALSRLRRDNREVVLAVAELPERIRGYEEHKLTSAAEAERRAAELLQQLERASLPVLSSA